MTLHVCILGTVPTVKVILDVVSKVYQLCYCDICHRAVGNHLEVVYHVIVKFTVRVCSLVELPCIYPILHKQLSGCPVGFFFTLCFIDCLFPHLHGLFTSLYTSQRTAPNLPHSTFHQRWWWAVCFGWGISQCGSGFAAPDGISFFDPLLVYWLADTGFLICQIISTMLAFEIREGGDQVLDTFTWILCCTFIYLPLTHVVWIGKLEITFVLCRGHKDVIVGWFTIPLLKQNIMRCYSNLKLNIPTRNCIGSLHSQDLYK